MGITVIRESTKIEYEQGVTTLDPIDEIVSEREKARERGGFEC